LEARVLSDEVCFGVWKGKRKSWRENRLARAGYWRCGRGSLEDVREGRRARTRPFDFVLGVVEGGDPFGLPRRRRDGVLLGGAEGRGDRSGGRLLACRRRGFLSLGRREDGLRECLGSCTFESGGERSGCGTGGVRHLELIGMLAVVGGGRSGTASKR
jgi:hypothetical protein